jgi:uncharacterized protein YdeI (YjbR/CyaY-like superfamily)
MFETEPRFFATPDELRAWFDANHATAEELILGMYRAKTGKRTISWSEAVDEALCVGWIDGIRRGLDDEAYTNRFTPRRKRSNWSAVNIAKVKQLIAEGRMKASGLAAFEARSDERSAIYSYEQRHIATLEPDDEARFRSNQAAWEWFETRPASYRKTAVYWVVSAKRPETRAKRLATLIEDSTANRPVKPLAPPAKPLAPPVKPG